MDIFVQRVPEHASQTDLDRIFKGPLLDCGCHDYSINKFTHRPLATITILDSHAAQVFLDRYEAVLGRRPKRNIYFANQYVKFSKSRSSPSDLNLRALVYQRDQRLHPVTAVTIQRAARTAAVTQFHISSMHCGTWTFESRLRSTPRLVFKSQSALFLAGYIHVGRRETRLVLGTPGSGQWRVDIPYRECSNIVLGTSEEPSVSFSLELPPKIYQIVYDVDDLSAQLLALRLGQPDRPPPKKVRVSGVNPAHERVAGCCFVYRVILQDARQLAAVKAILNRNATFCSVSAVHNPTEAPEVSLERAFVPLNQSLSETSLSGSQPFQLRYQIDRLARNGYLPPGMVVDLIPTINRLYYIHGLDATASGLKRFARDYNPPGPHTQADDHSLPALVEMLESFVASYDIADPANPYELVKRHAHVNLVHKVVITPTSIRLEGPMAEPTNRVLRKYPGKTDNFVRVLFQDEDGAPVRYDARTKLDLVYKRFKNVLDGQIAVIICGFAFAFLGFSHSSLRAQGCWLMTRFVSDDGTLLLAEKVIEDLGEFGHIRIPAKAAARIGQNFTDTNATVDIGDELEMIQDVERNGRVFSDGVGTISYELLRSIWRVYGSKRMLKPTVLQIRFQGAKGMVALDSRLQGSVLRLRPSMTKFESTSTQLEICGAGFKPLPMVLNRQFIKIMEDLGVPMDVFMALQNDAMKELRAMTVSPLNTAHLLDRSEITRATQLPSLIRYLGQIGLDYHQDPFLYSVVEMVVLSKLRDIKYRGRIPVEQGVTLYGIMDETGVLQPNEIFVVTERAPEGGRHVLVKNNVVVTRSPALHPGDMQLVNAVDVPDSSPLKKLSNAVVFSQFGDRDLASQLSGGDLDGDLFNVIWDDKLKPTQTFVAADYPRVVPEPLDRPVTRKDMSDFFVKFMETDVLGMLCNNHLQLSDMRPGGTLDQDCILIAGMASTAVDYSKTGIAVSMKDLPKFDYKLKPDFMVSLTSSENARTS